MILGRKIGMTQVWDEDDNVVPVTVIQAGPCAVSQVKTQATDGYDAVQIGFGDIKAKNVNKPMAGHFAKAGAFLFVSISNIPSQLVDFPEILTRV